MTQAINGTHCAESDEEFVARLLQGPMPRHIAIIMDGNGRWATRQGLPRVAGHQAGSESVRAAVSACQLMHVEALTLYTFSSENWRRPQEEVQALMFLIEHIIRREIEELDEANVRLRVLGRVHELPASLQEELRRDVERTANNTDLTLNLAINYSGRTELVDAMRALAEQVRSGTLAPEQISEEAIAAALNTHPLPDPDLLVRTAGEMRISNFLLWQIAYTEMWVTDTPWPAFTKRDLFQAVADYQRRQRKFGTVVDEE